MHRALFHAARGQGRTTPNPMVGAVVVSADGVVVGQGWHTRAGTAHAEVVALEEAGSAARGGTLYVTLEPCCHVGRTGPCTARVIAAGIRRVVAAMQDPDPRVSGRGFAQLMAAGIEVVEGVRGEEARRLNASFITVQAEARPLVMLKAATSLDARVAARRGERTAITGHAANMRTQQLRAAVDAIAVGSETVCVDDPLLTARACCRVRPLVRVIFDRRLRTSPTARIFSTLDAGPIVIVTTVRAATDSRPHPLEAAGATLVEAASLADGIRALLRWDVSTLLVEGGPTLQAALVREGLVDRLHLVVAPHALGPDGIQWLDTETLPRGWLTHEHVEPRGADLWIEADVHGTR